MFDESKEALIKRIENLEKTIESGNIKVSVNSMSNIKEDDVIANNQVEEVVYENVKSAKM